MANSLYMEKITAERSMRLTEEEQLAGVTTISMETVDNLGKDDLYMFVLEHLPIFMQYIKELAPNDQIALLSYYLLGKTQFQIGKLLHITQTMLSTKIRLASARLCLCAQGNPDQAAMAKTLTRLQVENTFDVPLSQLIAEYDAYRSYQYVADLHNLHRPAVRRVFNKLVHDLSEATKSEEIMLGAYLAGITDRASARGQGPSKRQERKRASALYHIDPDFLGEFRVDIANPDIEMALFAVGGSV